MGKFLEYLASESLFSDPDFCRYNAEYKEAVRLMCSAEESLQARLTGEDKQLFEQFSNALSDENAACATNRFVTGYRLGVLMTMEVFLHSERLMCGL